MRGIAYAYDTSNPSQGKDSSDDEELDDIPDDDQYDTEDSFIDDAELVRIFVYYWCFWKFVFTFLQLQHNVIGICLVCLILSSLLLMQDEYFEVDNSAIKHDGFFVNRGRLERM